MITITNTYGSSNASEYSTVKVNNMKEAKRVLRNVKKLGGREALKNISVYVPKIQVNTVGCTSQ